jgi:hypothetical protein
MTTHHYTELSSKKSFQIKELDYTNKVRKPKCIKEFVNITTGKKIKKTKENDIRFAEPILRQNYNAIIFPYTINVIKGQAGVHKSRFAELICSAYAFIDKNRV